MNETRNNRILVTALILSSLTASAFAATFYVKNDGNDEADGLSDATAWKTIAKVNATSFNTSDDVYFKAGDTWTGVLNIHWAGTSADRAIVGSYYLDNGVERTGVPSNGVKPKFQGSYPNIGKPDSIPSNIWAPLVGIYNNYVTVQNLHLYGSAGFGITLNTNQHSAIVENNHIDYSNGGSIFIGRSSYNSIIRGNYSSRCAWSEIDRIKLWPTHPGCVTAAKSHSNIFENNTLVDSGGEGIIVYESSYNNIIRDNTIASHRFASIYMDNAWDNVVERNIVLGDPAGLHYDSFAGIGVAVEEHYLTLDSSTGNIVRNNLIAGVHDCLSADVQAGAAAQGKKVGVQFLGNTCVGTKNAIILFDAAAEYTDVEIANNIFWDQDTGADACRAPSGLNFHNNLWGMTQNNGACTGPGDLSGNPGLASGTDFRLYGPQNLPHPTAFQPQPGSSAYGAGAGHTALLADYTGKSRAAPPAIGAFERIDRKIPVTKPTGLTLTIQ